MLLASAVEFFQVVLAIHILAVVIGFGVTFAYPILFAAARRADPTVLPWLYRTMQRFGRTLINPGLLVVVIAGIYLASHLHQWGVFYVQWGIGAVIVIGAIEGSFMIPREGRIARIAARDLAAAGGEKVTWSDDYSSAFRQLVIGGAVMDLVVIATVFMMAAHIGS
jgi:Predicted integral membrane protein (DUF2269)